MLVLKLILSPTILIYLYLFFTTAFNNFITYHFSTSRYALLCKKMNSFIYLPKIPSRYIDLIMDKSVKPSHYYSFLSHIIVELRSNRTPRQETTDNVFNLKLICLLLTLVTKNCHAGRCIDKSCIRFREVYLC